MKSPKQILIDVISSDGSRNDPHCLYKLRDTGAFEYLLDAKRSETSLAIKGAAEDVVELVLNNWLFNEWERPKKLEEMAVNYWMNNGLFLGLDSDVFEFSINGLILAYEKLKLKDDRVYRYMKSQDNYEKLPQSIKDEIEDYLAKNSSKKKDVE